MATSTLITARGKVTGVAGDVIHFAPSNTTYDLHLVCPGYSGTLNALVEGIIRVKARKAYTMPSGGNFITPLYGPPRIIQGRVRSIEGNSIVLHAGTEIHVDLPAEASAVELANGAIAVGGPMVNVVAFPGATFELIK
jgi:hypothetical protein